MQELLDAGPHHAGPERLLRVPGRHRYEEAALRIHTQRAGGLPEQLRVLAIGGEQPRKQERALRLLLLRHRGELVEVAGVHPDGVELHRLPHAHRVLGEVWQELGRHLLQHRGPQDPEVHPHRPQQ